MRRLLGFFIPTEIKFFELLERQSANVLGASSEFSSFLANYNKSSVDSKRKSMHKIRELERKGDRHSYEIIEILNKSLVTPFDREDIHQMAVLLDDVLDLIDGSSRKFILFKVKKIPPLMAKQCRLMHQMVEKIHSATKKLEKLNEVKEYCSQIYLIESSADELYEDAISELFEKNGNAIETIKLKEIYETIEEVFDKCKEIADAMQEIIVKHS